MSPIFARKPRRRPWRRFAVTGALLLTAWLGGFLWFRASLQDTLPAPIDAIDPLAASLEAPGEGGGKANGTQAPGPVTEAIVVLTGGAGRIEAGLDLLAAGAAEQMLISGVYHGIEVRQLLRLAEEQADELACCVELGYEAENTRGNAAEAARWMADRRFTSMRLVTADYHMPRALLEFRHAMPDLLIVPHPVATNGHPTRQPGLLMREYSKLIVTAFRTGAQRLGSAVSAALGRTR